MSRFSGRIFPKKSNKTRFYGISIQHRPYNVIRFEYAVFPVGRTKRSLQTITIKLQGRCYTLTYDFRNCNTMHMLRSCCKCISMDPGPCPVPKVDDRSSEPGEKFYQEIATEMIGNALIIRVEKDPKKKMRKLLKSWDPPCDCEMVEIRRPGAEGESAKIVNGGDNNQVLFKVYSKSKILKDDGSYKPQAIAYKVGSCRGGNETNDQCRTITVHPQMGGPGSQEVHSDHVTEGSQDVFLLRIKKNPDTMDHKRRNIELELRTPRPPTPQPEPEVNIEEAVPVVEENQKKTKEVGKGKGKKGKGKKMK